MLDIADLEQSRLKSSTVLSRARVNLEVYGLAYYLGFNQNIDPTIFKLLFIGG